MQKVLLIVRDGWGFTQKKEGNAIYHAKTPFDDYLMSSTQQVLLNCSGKAVGLPPGFQGSSEVGHLNMGAGRIVKQEVTRIFEEIKNKRLFNSKRFSLIKNVLEKKKSNVHLVGLLQDEGVHAHQEHLFEMIHYFKQRFPDVFIWVHPIADGRDTPPRSFTKFFRKLQDVIKKYENIDIGTVWGRYYGMDRSKNWNLIDIAYKAMLYAEGILTNDIVKTVHDQYANKLTPDGVPMFDEYLEPIINESFKGIKKEDVVINFNYRQDRAIQISKAFVDKKCPIYRQEASFVYYFGLTKYYDEFENYLIEPLGNTGSMEKLLGEIISGNGLKQLRISETQKFRHVTSFFNGKSTTPYKGEDQVEIRSEFDPSSFASHPEMNAEDVTNELEKRLEMEYAFILVNYANCDMVGHTGDFEAAIRGAEIVDINVARIAKSAMRKGYTIIVTADHGNSEEMIDENGEPKTSHTTNPVKLHILSGDKKITFKTDKGILSDIAPLILKMMGLPIPSEMTSDYLAEHTEIK